MEQDRNVLDHLEQKLSEAKTHFERALDCKHTEFDDLYPYMIEHPQFFWYKRYVAWSELLTVVRMAEELNIDWKPLFSERQIKYISKKVLEGNVLDHWFEAETQKKT